MNKRVEKLVSHLFETKAVRVCEHNSPFWYTSGTIGPYYINTHFLYGSEDKANSLLSIIDKEKSDVKNCSLKILEATEKNYSEDPIYRGVIDEMCAFINENINLNEVDLISGGERRDWFFSIIIAKLLKKPHITIFKNMEMTVFSEGVSNEIGDLTGKKVLHIADLITEASSYERAWIPAINSKKAEIKWSVVVVDRKQGGSEYLESKGINPFSMVQIDAELFNKAAQMELISTQQYKMVEEYAKDPKGSMKTFLINNPGFIEESRQKDAKTKERVNLCLEKNIYGL